MERNEDADTPKDGPDKGSLYPPIFAKAETAARDSRLPGWDGGPADAFRHIVASAELAREYGETLARALGQMNELKGTILGQKSDDEKMDSHNNEIGIRIGLESRSFEEIIERTKIAIDDAAQSGPGSPSSTPTWHPPSRWSQDTWDRDRTNWPPTWKEGREGDAERVLARPVAQWSKDDVRKVQNARVYWRGEGPARDIAFGKVRQWYEERESVPRKPGGPVTVDAYTRSDGSRVAAHARATPHRVGASR